MLLIKQRLSYNKPIKPTLKSRAAYGYVQRNKMKGIFSLKNPADLFRKLEHDFNLIQERPDDPYVAFNFFVTAEHMLDWQYSGYSNKNLREELRNSEMILQICSHLASGAKHFTVQAKQHKSVSETAKRAVYSGGALHKGSFCIGAIPKYSIPGKWSDELFVELSGEASVTFDKAISVVVLAEQILEFWRDHLKLKGSD